MCHGGPPDGGCRAWLIVFARFVLSFMVMGSFKALGVFVPVLHDNLQLSATVVGFSVGLSGALNFIFGPVTAAILQKINYRVMVMIGGTLSSSGLILAGQAKAASHLTFSMILQGIGNCVVAIPAVIALHDYFDKKFALANGLSTAGGAFGMIALSPFAEFLIERYGWRGAFLIVGGLAFNMVAAGALMRPLERTKQDVNKQPVEADTEICQHKDENMQLSGKADIEAEQIQDVNNIDEKLHSTSCSDRNQDAKRQLFVKDGIAANSNSTQHNDTDTDIANMSNACYDDEMYTSRAHGDTDAGSMQYHKDDGIYTELQSCEETNSYSDFVQLSTNSTFETESNSKAKYHNLEIEHDSDLENTACGDHIKEKRNFFSKCCRSTVTSLGFRLLLKEKHLLLCFIGFLLWGIVYSGWTLFLVSYGISKNLSTGNAALLSSLGGLGTLIGRIAHGPFIDRNIITGSGMYSLLSFIGAITLFLYAFVSGFAGFGVLSAVVGLCIGTRSVLGIVVIKENVEAENFSEAAGWSYFFQGVGTVIGSPLTGLAYDLTSTFRAAFFIMAGLEVLVCVLFLAVPRIKQYSTSAA